MEYCGLELKAGSISGARRELDLRLRDLESVAGQLAGDHDEVQSNYLLCSLVRLVFLPREGLQEATGEST